jgi:hemolysin III
MTANQPPRAPRLGLTGYVSFLPVLPKRTPPGLPAFRGLLHAWAFSLAVPAGITIGVMAGGGRARVAAAIFGGTVVAMFGLSALYHRFAWSPGAKRLLRKLDHLGIFGLIAGSYTAIGLLVLSGTSRIVVLSIVWAGVGIAIITKFVWTEAPKWLSAVIGVALGWVGISVFPQLLHRAGVTPAVLILVGGGLYTLGAIIYARRRPDPAPAYFGYHELFHALVVAAVGLHYSVVGSLVIR